MPTEMNGLTLGMVVLKLLAAMKDEKHAPGKDAYGQADHGDVGQLRSQQVGHQRHRIEVALVAAG